MDRPVNRRLAAALAVAAVATAGSLSYSLLLGLYPCRLCWYQRILMYPLVVLLGWGLLAGEDGVAVPALALSVPGAAVAAYHSWLQVTGTGGCGLFACSTVQHRALGLTIPNQALVAFLLVTALAVLQVRLDRRG
jgi:disulfide bond formation protein DsbB